MKGAAIDAAKFGTAKDREQVRHEEIFGSERRICSTGPRARKDVTLLGGSHLSDLHPNNRPHCSVARPLVRHEAVTEAKVDRCGHASAVVRAVSAGNQWYETNPSSRAGDVPADSLDCPRRHLHPVDGPVEHLRGGVLNDIPEKGAARSFGRPSGPPSHLHGAVLDESAPAYRLSPRLKGGGVRDDPGVMPTSNCGSVTQRRINKTVAEPPCQLHGGHLKAEQKAPSRGCKAASASATPTSLMMAAGLSKSRAFRQARSSSPVVAVGASWKIGNGGTAALPQADFLARPKFVSAPVSLTSCGSFSDLPSCPAHAERTLFDWQEVLHALEQEVPDESVQQVLHDFRAFAEKEEAALAGQLQAERESKEMAMQRRHPLKLSKKVLELRKIEKTLGSSSQYAEAAKVQAQANMLEDEDYQKHADDLSLRMSRLDEELCEREDEAAQTLRKRLAERLWQMALEDQIPSEQLEAICSALL